MKSITVNDLPNVSEQELSDYITNFLLNQNEKSIDPQRHFCRYRMKTSTGKVLHCAIGCLFPNEIYNETFEYYSYEELIEIHNFPREHFDLLIAFLRIHDGENVTSWEEAIKNRIYKAYNLQWIK